MQPSVQMAQERRKDLAALGCIPALQKPKRSHSIQNQCAGAVPPKEKVKIISDLSSCEVGRPGRPFHIQKEVTPLHTALA